MTQSLLQAHVDQVRADLRRALSVLGTNPISPPKINPPAESVVKTWI